MQLPLFSLKMLRIAPADCKSSVKEREGGGSGIHDKQISQPKSQQNRFKTEQDSASVLYPVGNNGILKIFIINYPY